MPDLFAITLARRQINPALLEYGKVPLVRIEKWGSYTEFIADSKLANSDWHAR